MALRPRVAPLRRPEDARPDGKASKIKASKIKASKKQPSKGQSEDTPERKKKTLKRKKKKARWSRNYRKTHKVELRDYQRAWRAEKRKDPEFVEKERKKNRTYSRNKRYAAYGMTIADYNVMKAQQSGLCLICKGKRKRKKPNPKKKNKDRRRHNGKRLCVDHCHKPKMVRGLLCGRCNCMIGYGDDDPWILNEGRKYLIAFLKGCAAKEKKR